MEMIVVTRDLSGCSRFTAKQVLLPMFKVLMLGIVMLSGFVQLARGATMLTVAPTSLSWNAVAVGNTGGPKSVTLTNGGTSTVTFSSAAVSGADASDFSLSDDSCGTTLAASASCSVTVLFKPSAAGTRTATLTFTDSDPSSPQTVALTGTGTAASSGTLTVSPTSLSWYSVAVGNTGGAKSVTLTNGSSSASTISSVAVTGADAADFIISANTCGSSLAASASCTVTVAFKPAAAGSRTATLSFTDSAANSPQTVALSGTGTAASGTVTASPASLAFGSVTVGSSSSSMQETLTNGSASAVSISSIAVSGADAADFTLSSNSCGTSLAASASCTVTVIFKPTAAGSRTATLTFTDSAGNSPQTVALSGTGTTASGSVTVSTSSLSWNAVAVGNTGGAKSVTLSNGGSSAVTLNSIAVTGTDATEFIISSNSCGTSLAASATCTVSVQFRPAAAGTRTASLTFIDSDPSRPQTVALSGLGTGTGAVTVSPSSLAFGSVAVGSSSSLTETLTNGTSGAITISSIAVSGANAADFTISSNSCGTSLAASATCSVTVVFKPAAAGSRTGTLTFTDSAANSPQTVALSGTGTAASGSVTVSPSSLAFGSVTVGSSSSLTETLTNGTSSAITISSIAVSGADAADFTVSGNSCGTSLAASTSCSVTVLFQPAATGSRTATLTFKDSATNSPQTVALSGTGTSSSKTGSVTVSPASLEWGTLIVGMPGTQQTVTLHNSGSSAVPVSSIALTSTDPGDFSITGNSCGSSLGDGASCTVTVNFKPTAEGSRVALLSFTDGGTGSPQTVELSGTGGPVVSQSASITVDFGSRSGTQVSVPANMLAVEYFDSLPDSASRETVVQAGIHTSRTHANVTGVYATPTPDWTKIDGSMKTFQAAGVHPILIIDTTPPWLVPSPVMCKSAPDTSVPSDLNKWGEMAASYVKHLDATFPGLVTDYEVWNEPNNTGALCSSNKLADYLDIYAAAAPLMKAQAEADGATVRVGGPASAGVAWPSLLTDPRTAPYVDFYSYHLYLSSGEQIHDGMTWDGTGGKPSLYQMILSGTSGEQARYKEALSYVKDGKTPLGAKTPVYFSEFNDNYAFEADCCRNDPTYSPLFNSMVVAQIFNSVYSGASQLPTKMVYYAAAQKPFCVLGVADAAMDCTPATSNAQLTPYPQLYTYQLISAPGYLDLVDGGHMASSVTLSSAAESQGLIATAYYTATTDSILIINPTSSSFSGVTVGVNNPGFSSPNATLFTVNEANRRISAWPAALLSTSGGAQARFDIPAHSVLAISLKAGQ